MKKPPPFSEVALRLKSNGYEPLPVSPGSKNCYVDDWNLLCINDDQVQQWVDTYPAHNTGIRLTDGLVCIDIDLLHVDAVLAVQKVIDEFIKQQLDDAAQGDEP